MEVDSDHDEIGDNEDLDDDNDGLSDQDEIQVQTHTIGIPIVTLEGIMTISFL